jgi:hypothetical protein
MEAHARILDRRVQSSFLYLCPMSLRDSETRYVDTFASVLEPSASCEEVVCHWRDDVTFCSRSNVQQAKQEMNHSVGT